MENLFGFSKKKNFVSFSKNHGGRPPYPNIQSAQCPYCGHKGPKQGKKRKGKGKILYIG